MCAESYKTAKRFDLAIEQLNLASAMLAIFVNIPTVYFLCNHFKP